MFLTQRLHNFIHGMRYSDRLPCGVHLYWQESDIGSRVAAALMLMLDVNGPLGVNKPGRHSLTQHHDGSAVFDDPRIRQGFG